MKAESVCPKDELNEGAVNRVDQSERNAEIGAPESECWRWSGGGGSGFSGFAGLDSEQPVDRNVNTDSESYVLDSESITSSPKYYGISLGFHDLVRE